MFVVLDEQVKLEQHWQYSTPNVGSLKKFTKFMQIVFNLHFEISNIQLACSLTFTFQFSYPFCVDDADEGITHIHTVAPSETKY